MFTIPARTKVRLQPSAPNGPRWPRMTSDDSYDSGDSRRPQRPLDGSDDSHGFWRILRRSTIPYDLWKNFEKKSFLPRLKGSSKSKETIVQNFMLYINKNVNLISYLNLLNRNKILNIKNSFHKKEIGSSYE